MTFVSVLSSIFFVDDVERAGPEIGAAGGVPDDGRRDDHALNRPVAAYRYVTPYSALTDLPFTVEIRNHDGPGHDLARAGRAPRRTLDPRHRARPSAPVWIEVRTRAAVEADVRRFAGQSAIFG